MREDRDRGERGRTKLDATDPLILECLVFVGTPTMTGLDGRVGGREAGSEL